MSTVDPLINDSYKEYVRLLQRLHQLFVEGREDSPEADALRDKMDKPWDKLSLEQRDSVGGLCADLNWLLDGPVPTKKSREELFQKIAPALTRAEESSNQHEVLEYLRELAPYLPPAELAVRFGRAWSQLGLEEIAHLFFEHAKQGDDGDHHQQLDQRDTGRTSRRGPEHRE
jgi:hypothetical protein